MGARSICVLGSTGSVGVSTLDLLDQAGADVEVFALTAGRNVKKLAEQQYLRRVGQGRGARYTIK